MEEIEIPQENHVRERIYDSIMNLSLFNGLKSDELHIVANHTSLNYIPKNDQGWFEGNVGVGLSKLRFIRRGRIWSYKNHTRDLIQSYTH